MQSTTTFPQGALDSLRIDSTRLPEVIGLLEPSGPTSLTVLISVASGRDETRLRWRSSGPEIAIADFAAPVVKVTPCASVGRWSDSQDPVWARPAVHWVVLREQAPLNAVQGSFALPPAAGSPPTMKVGTCTFEMR